MARRKNTKRFDPRYFMDEKVEKTISEAGKISKNRKGQKLHPAGKPMEEGSNDYGGEDWEKNAAARMQAFDDHFGDGEDEAGHDDHIVAGKLADKIYDLANAVYDYGSYDTETQFEAYRQLLQAMKESGVNLKRMLITLHESPTRRKLLK